MMDRKQEYWDLVSALDETPPALAETVARARARRKMARGTRWLGIPVAALGGLASAFVLLVNCSIPFALAFRDVPFLRQLAAAAAFSPMLKAAVENDFFQYVGQSQTANGITVTVHYLILDQSQVNVFFALDADPAMSYWVDLDVISGEGTALPWAGGGREATGDGAMTPSTLSLFGPQELPETLRLRLRVTAQTDHTAAVPAPAPEASEDWRWDPGPSEYPLPLAELNFDLPLDPRFTTLVETVEIGRWIELDGQRILVKRMEIYPLSARLELEDAPENTAWLKGLTYYLEDEKGNRYQLGNGTLAATGNPDSPAMLTYYMDSGSLAGAEHLTLYLIGTEWQSKEYPMVTLDLVSGEANNMPQDVAIQSVERVGADVRLSVSYPGFSGSILKSYYGPDGVEQYWDSLLSTRTDIDRDGQRDACVDYVTFRDYPWDTVVLSLYLTHGGTLESPVAVELK